MRRRSKPPKRQNPSGPSRGRLPLLQRPVEYRLAAYETLAATHAERADFREGLTSAGVADDAFASFPEGIALARTALDAHTTAVSAAGKASAALDRVLAEAEAAHALVYNPAREAGKHDPDLGAALDVGRREKERPDRLAQMRRFLDAARTQAPALARVGVKTAALAALDSTLTDADEAHAAWEAYAAHERAADDGLAAATAPLDDTVRDVQQRAADGLNDRPDLLELLHLRPRRPGS